MLLTLKTTHSPATDLGYLLHKNPQNQHTFSLPCGEAHLFFPKKEQDLCIAALLLEIDPIALVRKEKEHVHDTFSLKHYVNDRPYVASSFLSMALAKVFRSAFKGTCKEKPELLNRPLPLEATLAALPCRSETGKELLKELFEPLGYDVDVQEYLLDQKHPEWGKAQHYTLTLKSTCYLKDLLSHLYVLIPVLDNEKHYWVSQDEIDKLLNHGEGWLREHPKKELISSRYLKRQSSLTREALERLLDEDRDKTEQVQEEKPLTLHQQRMQAVLTVLKEHQVRRIVDLGCGEGVLLKSLLEESSFESILGVDVSYKALERAKVKLNLDRLAPKQRNRIKLIQGSLNYTDKRLLGFDALTLVEVIEHVDPSRLPTLESVVFGFTQPKIVIVTTPNGEYNHNFEGLPSGSYRHSDHRFEWTQEAFQTWAENVAKRYDYSVTFQPIGPQDKQLLAPTQMGIFTNQR